MHRFPQADPEGIHIKNWSNYGAGETAPFQSLTEEEVMAQMKQGPSLRQWRNFVGIVVLVVAVCGLLVLCAGLFIHSVWLLFLLGWSLF